MGMNKPDIHNALQLRRTALVFDHFNEYVSGSGHLWTSGGSGGTVANNDGDGGILTLTTGAVQDQDAFVASTRKNWTFVSGKPLIFQIGCSYTEANTNKAGIYLGMASSFVDVLVDTTYVLASPLSGVGIYKKPGDTLWTCFTSIGSTQYATQSTAPCQLAGIMQEFIIQVMVVGTSIEVTFFTGGMPAATITGGGGTGLAPMIPNVTTMARQQPIKHVVAYSGAAAMSMGASIKAGSGSSEVLSVDYIGSEFLSIP